jgi:hypothetical protein
VFTVCLAVASDEFDELNKLSSGKSSITRVGFDVKEDMIVRARSSKYVRMWKFCKGTIFNREDGITLVEETSELGDNEEIGVSNASSHEQGSYRTASAQ